MKNRRYFSQLFHVLIGFLIVAAVVFTERKGLQYVIQHKNSPYLEQETDRNNKKPAEGVRCLFLYNSEEKESVLFEEQMRQILTDMRVWFEEVDVKDQPMVDFSQYQTVVIGMGNWDVLHENLDELSQWVFYGGRCMFGVTPIKTEWFDIMGAKIGVLESEYENVMTEDLVFADDFMIGSGKDAWKIDMPYEASLTLRLDEKAQIYAKTSSDIPVIWKQNYGTGCFVVDNFGYYEKAYRGIFAMSYTLLEDICIYPVINAAAFYIDDFPSPVPMGNGIYIQRDYNMSIAGFYSNVWWPDMLKLGERYQIPYTGMIIETYEDNTAGELEPNKDTARYQYFGHMLLAEGGELGYHGYNHQPLCLKESAYLKKLGYHDWENKKEMEDSVAELARFCGGLFPKETFSVYVPPSNILSEEGRAMLSEQFKDIRTIASIYLQGVEEYEQEFEVAEDGIIETPRIISGCQIDSYMRLVALSELNFHFISSHFLHPDDLLDEDRGAKEGWEALRESLDSYMNWLFSSAPAIRRLTGSQMGGAVERFSALSFQREETEEEIRLVIDGLKDEAYLMACVNQGKIGKVIGAEPIPLTDRILLLRVTEPEVVLRKR